MPQYKTVNRISTGEYKEKGSTFIAYLKQVNNEIEIREYLDLVRKENHKARHVCYAWQIGFEKPHQRTNDDGEPTYTAGVPILNQIKKYELTNVIVAVVRYFGGVLLGKGGLIQAYSSAAANAILNNEIVPIVPLKNIRVELDYSHFNQLSDIISQMNAKIISQSFSDKCVMNLEIQEDLLKEFISQIENIPSLKVLSWN